MTPDNVVEIHGIHTHILEHMGIPVVVPFAKHDMRAYEFPLRSVVFPHSSYAYLFEIDTPLV